MIARPLLCAIGNASTYFLGPVTANSKRCFSIFNKFDRTDWIDSPKVPKTDLNSFGGNLEVIAKVADVVRYLQDPKTFTELGAKAPKGIILSGPPGVGKSFLAEAIAGHAGVPFFLINAGAVQSTSVGGTEKRLRKAFNDAEKTKRALICIDEIDAIGSARIKIDGVSRANDHYVNGIVAQLLTLLSKDREGVVVMATTNHFNSLDSALVRPGRFDRHIVLALPSFHERKSILEIHTKDKKLSPDVTLENLAQISVGFSSAKLSSWVNEAAIAAAREGSPLIDARHIIQARTIISFGILRPSITDSVQKERIAAHEAGHAIVGHILGLKLFMTTIRQGANSGGNTEWIPLGDEFQLTKEIACNTICTLLAGRAAELEINCPTFGSEEDIKHAKEIAERMAGKEAMESTFYVDTDDVEQILQYQMLRAQNIIKLNKKLWERVKEALKEHEDLSREDFMNAMAGNILEPKKKVDPELSQLLPAPKKVNATAQNQKIEYPGISEEEARDRLLKIAGRVGTTLCVIGFAHFVYWGITEAYKKCKDIF